MSRDKAHDNIRRIRKSLGLSQAAMAEELGIGRTAYINFETGRTLLYSRNLVKFSAYTGISESSIICSEFREDSEGSLLRDEGGEQLRMKAVREDYEKRIAELQEKLAEVDASLKHQIQVSESLIKTNEFLMGRLDKND
ncbi:MAG: helix-turn-helix domain-containing protein [Candidatus Cryptobacteroides sp.]|nr:helix-turn-helix transcriptional regulator [Bacteroidales bacterium]